MNNKYFNLKKLAINTVVKDLKASDFMTIITNPGDDEVAILDTAIGAVAFRVTERELTMKAVFDFLDFINGIDLDAAILISLRPINDLMMELIPKKFDLDGLVLRIMDRDELIHIAHLVQESDS